MKFDTELFVVGINAFLASISYVSLVGPNGNWFDAVVLVLCLMAIVCNFFYREDEDDESQNA